MCAHVLLIETDAHGLVIVDTGCGLDDNADLRGRLGAGFVFATGAQPNPAQTALRQVEALGFSGADVKHLVLTHLDLDHAGGIPDFPHATVHLLAAEHSAATKPTTFMERERYKQCHWAHGPNWSTYTPDGEAWRGFAAARELRGLPPEILMIPVTGHTRGHACVAVETASGPLVHCGDAYFHHHALEGKPIPGFIRTFERVAAVDGKRIRDNHARLGELAKSGDGIKVFCAHDMSEYEALANA